MARTMFILYVADQDASRKFYAVVLEKDPALDLPGMTEFALTDDASLGLMPVKGIKSLLGDALPDPGAANGIPRAELYLPCTDVSAVHARALAAGARELRAPLDMPWGDRVAYCLDPDGHVLACAQSLST